MFGNLTDGSLYPLSALGLRLDYDPSNSWQRSDGSYEFKKQKKFAWSQFSSAKTFASVRCSIPECPPTLFPVEYCRSWKLAVLAFPHNALRAELVDMFDILENIANLGLSLQWLNIHHLSMWWQVSVAFLNNYFHLEDKVHAEAERELAVLSFRDATALRRLCVNERSLEVSNFLSLLNCWQVCEIIPKVSHSIREFLPRLPKYMAKEDKYHPAVLAGQPYHDETNKLLRLALCGAVPGFFNPRASGTIADVNLRAMSALRVSLSYEPSNSWQRRSGSSEYKKQKKSAWSQFRSVEALASLRCSLPECPPTLFLVEYCRFWKPGVFVFPHNALCAELLHMCDILEDIAHHGLSLQSLYIHRMSMWWQTIVAFLNNYFQFEDKVERARGFPFNVSSARTYLS